MDTRQTSVINRYMTAVLFVGLSVSHSLAQEDIAQRASTEGGQGNASLIDAEAAKRVNAMSAHLSKQKRFRFAVDIMYDAVEADGQKIQLARTSNVEVRRPNGLRAESRGDRGWHKLSTYDGSHFLIHDQAQKVYSRVATPPTFGKFFEFLFEKYGASPPLADFLMEDVHAVLMDGAESGGMLGDAVVAGKDCDHIAFSGELLDWQVWIQKGDQPWPRKFVVTYKDVAVRPQFMAVIREWQADSGISDDRFVTAAPGDATKVELDRFGDEAGGDDVKEDAQGNAREEG